MNKQPKARKNINIDLRNMIGSYYIPEQLMSAILKRGSIPEVSQEQYVGVAFLDIAKYSYLSNFISAKENQLLLNGLFTAFYNILVARNGYLNKIEGDSIMFHFGGELDANMAGLDLDEQLRHISRELFYACVEMQEACALFNHASNDFLSMASNKHQRTTLANALAIIEALRAQGEITNSLHALFQIRIRIGAAIGKVAIGNFGPPGAKQWDIIGLPVILAKRMETTAPHGGIRISKEFYNILDKSGYVNEYCDLVRKNGHRVNSSYKNIKNHEVFQYRKIILKEKDAAFESYSVQVNAALPRDIKNQILALLKMQNIGADRIIELFMHYRGNSYIIDEIEDCFAQLSIKIRKADLLKLIFPKRYREMAGKYGTTKSFEDAIDVQYSLFDIFDKMNHYQTVISHEPEYYSMKLNSENYDKVMEVEHKKLDEANRKRTLHMVQRSHFFNTVIPLVHVSLKYSIIEYQNALAHSESISSLLSVQSNSVQAAQDGFELAAQPDLSAQTDQLDLPDPTSHEIPELVEVE
ncbi:MAG: adenylate/guanylate cyclase domain-containing protein [Salinispira sp.]